MPLLPSEYMQDVAVRQTDLLVSKCLRLTRGQAGVWNTWISPKCGEMHVQKQEETCRKWLMNQREKSGQDRSSSLMLPSDTHRNMHICKYTYTHKYTYTYITIHINIDKYPYTKYPYTQVSIYKAHIHTTHTHANNAYVQIHIYIYTQIYT